jgi:hypothetical protein
MGGGTCQETYLGLLHRGGAHCGEHRLGAFDIARHRTAQVALVSESQFKFDIIHNLVLISYTAVSLANNVMRGSVTSPLRA